MNKRSEEGFALVTVVLFSLLLAGAMLALFWQVVASAVLGLDASGQLRSQVVAENGLALARVALAEGEIGEILLGANGVLDAAASGPVRDPLELDDARRGDPASLQTPWDDGLFHNLGLLTESPGYPIGEEDWVFLRVSNDPDELPGRDDDGTVIVRSLGVVRGDRFPGRPASLLNHVTLLEAKLRKERAFETDRSLNLVGSGLALNWAAEIPKSEPPLSVSVVEFPEAGLYHSVVEALRSAIAGATVRVMNDSGDRLAEEAFRRILGPEFWRGLDRRLDTARTGDPGRLDQWGLHFLPEGGEIAGAAKGLIFVFGDTAITGDAVVEGVLVHLGRGGLRLTGNARLSGALWMLSLPGLDPAGSPEPGGLCIDGGAILQFDQEAVRSALAYLPVTQIYWRMIFPETGS